MPYRYKLDNDIMMIRKCTFVCHCSSACKLDLTLSIDNGATEVRAQPSGVRELQSKLCQFKRSAICAVVLRWFCPARQHGHGMPAGNEFAETCAPAQAVRFDHQVRVSGENVDCYSELVRTSFANEPEAKVCTREAKTRLYPRDEVHSTLWHMKACGHGAQAPYPKSRSAAAADASSGK